MSAHRMTVGQYKQLKRLMRIAQDEVHSLYRTKGLIAGMFPPVPGLGVNVDYAVDHGLTAATLLRLQGVKVKGKR